MAEWRTFWIIIRPLTYRMFSVRAVVQQARWRTLANVGSWWLSMVFQMSDAYSEPWHAVDLSDSGDGAVEWLLEVDWWRSEAGR